MEKPIAFLLDQGLDHLNIFLDASQKKQILNFISLLEVNNRLFNLTGFKTPFKILTELIFDSLSLLNTNYSFENIFHIIDVGTGAGIPGIPLKIVFPHIHFLLLDSNQKKINFLKLVSHTLGLQNITFINDRSEFLGKNPSYREYFDLAVSRALSFLPSNLELVTPFVKVNKDCIFYKGVSYKEEIRDSFRAFLELNCEIKTVKKSIIPFSNRLNYFILVKKIRSTPKMYPRRNGVPQKRPLI